jgi:excisionase family DNA binding protein
VEPTESTSPAGRPRIVSPAGAQGQVAAAARHGGSELPEAAERLAYTVEEAAAILGIGRDLIYDEIRTGRLRSKKAGARRIIGRHHLLAWLDGEQPDARRRAS